MDCKIKTRQVHKDIKVLDKTVTVTDHVKQSYVRTKETVIDYALVYVTVYVRKHELYLIFKVCDKNFT